MKSWLGWPYRVVVWLLPVRLRREHGEEMLAHHTELAVERWQRRGPVSAIGWVLRDVADVVVTAVRARGRGRPRGSDRRYGMGTGNRRRHRVDRLWQDVRFAVRTWRRSPGFAVVALITLALAIGANTAIFTVVDAVLLRPLPYRSAGELVMIHQKLQRLGWDRGPVSYPNFEDWRRDAKSIRDMSAFRSRVPRTLTGSGDAEQVAGAESTPNLFDLLGVAALRGRTFASLDAGDRVVVLGESLWRRRYGADPSLIGRSITLNGASYTVLGVMPSGFDFPSVQDEYWIQLPEDAPRDDRDLNYLQVVSRLAPGSTIEGARVEMQSIFDRMRQAYPDVFGTNQPNVESLRDVVSGGTRPTLVMLTLAVALLLLVACANLANLVLIRATGRAHELAVRRAIGAERGRVIRQLVTESGLLAFIGGGIGVGIAVAGTRVLQAIGPQSIPRRQAIAVDGRALAFTLIIAVFTGLLFGVLPALRATGSQTEGVLRDSGRSGASRRTGRLQRGLVIAQIGLAFVLLTGAGLLVNSFARLTGTASGMDPAGVLSARLSPPNDRYVEPAQVRAYFDDVLQRVGSLPGVDRAGGSYALPFTPGMASGRMIPEGATIARGEEPTIGLYPVRGDYFEALGIRLLAGRLPGPEDGVGAPPVVAINQAAAERLWPGQNAIGKRFCRCTAAEVGTLPWITVVGVVGTAKRFDLGENPEMESYWSYEQAEWARDMWIAIRTQGDPLALVEPLRAVVRAIDPDVPLTNVRTLADRISTSVSQPRFRTFVVTCFAGLGILLAFVGIYGIMAFAVAQRTREIGLRMALGARRATVLRGVVLEGARLIFAGLLIGGLGALAFSRTVAGMLYRITPLDAPTWLSVAAVLGLGATLACLVPAGRASRVAPLVALRED